MVNPAETVTIELEARVREFERRIDGARRKFDQDMGRIERSGQRAARGVSGSFGGLGRAAGGFATAAGVATAALGALAASRAYIQIVDGAKQIEAQLRLATKESGSFATAQSDVRRIAQETRTELAATAQLYSVFQRNALDLGIAQSESARATETVTKAFRISRATAAEAAGGLRQFLQGVQSGTLRGEELNSVLENAPRLARLLADSLNVTIGELRKLGQEGDLTADKLIAALTDRKFTAAIDEEFKQLPVTFGEAIQQVENAASIVFSAFDEGGEFSRALVNFVQSGTGGFEDLEDSAREFGITVRSNLDGIVALFEPLVDLANDFGAAIESIGFSPSFLGALSQLPGAQIFQLGSQLPSFQDARNASRQQAEDRITNRQLNDIVSLDRIFDPAPQARARPARSSGSGGAAAARRAAAERARAERERISAIRDAADAEQRLADLAQSIEDARAALATTIEDQVRFQLEAADNDRETFNRRIATEQEIGALTEQEADNLRQLNDQRTELLKEAIRRNRDAQEFRLAERQAQRDLDTAIEIGRAEAEILQAQRNLARTSDQRRAVDEQLINLQFDEERARNDFLITYAARLEAQAELLGLEQDEIDAARAQAEIAAARNATLEERRGLAQQGSAESNASPLQSFLLSIPQTADELNESLENVAANGLASVVDGLTDAIVNFRSLGDVGRSILQSLTAQLVRLALQQIVLKTIGATAGNAATAATKAQAATTAAAWAPAASLASLATLGSNAGPAAIALSTTTALSQALAATGGLRDGGPVEGPGGPRDDRVLKRLSDGEYVINAASARQIGRNALDFINSTGQLPTGLRDGGAAVPFRIPNAPAQQSGGGGGMAGLDPASVEKLAKVVDAASRSMPPVQVFPTLDPGKALAAGLNSPGGQRAFFDFLTANRGRFSEAI